jgi:hypothetical protein
MDVLIMSRGIVGIDENDGSMGGIDAVEVEGKGGRR